MYEQDLMQSLALIYLGLTLHYKSRRRESAQGEELNFQMLSNTQVIGDKGNLFFVEKSGETGKTSFTINEEHKESFKNAS